MPPRGGGPPRSGTRRAELWSARGAAWSRRSSRNGPTLPPRRTAPWCSPCGPGNNGGDGFVVARLLRDWGWGVAVFLIRRPGAAAAGCAGEPRTVAREGRGFRLSRATWGAAVGAGAGSVSGAERSLLIDALFGTGLTRAIDLPLVDLAPDRMRRPERRIVSVDLPSGLCSDSGRRAWGGAACRSGRSDRDLPRRKAGAPPCLGAGGLRQDRGVDIGLAARRLWAQRRRASCA